MTSERVADYIAELEPTRSPYTVLSRVQNLYDALRAMAPEADWSWLLETYRTLSAGVRPVRDKLSRLRSIDELAALGECLMAKAEASARLSAVRRAVMFRDGLMIAVLSYRPIRLKNFAGMRLGRHLKKAGCNWHILLAAAETKTRVPYQTIFPSALTPKLERYLDAHRPVLMRRERADGRADAAPIHPGLDAVWISEVGTHLTQEVAGMPDCKTYPGGLRPKRLPHLFRDAAATSIAVDNPKYKSARSLEACVARRIRVEGDYRMRAVIYTRYSSDQQRATSIDDQIRLCKERNAREGWVLVQVYRDAAISGATSSSWLSGDDGRRARSGV